MSAAITFVVQRCPKCNKKLVRVVAGAIRIGSPLVTCSKCNIVYVTQLQVEWYKYKLKWMVFALPFILAALGLLIGTILEHLALGIMGAMFMFIVGLGMSSVDIVRMFKSKRRMRDSVYINRLFRYNVIDQNEYMELLVQSK